MKLKYYMRGLGVGIVLTTLLLILLRKDISEDEIVRRAMELGMVIKEDPEGNLDDIYHGKPTEVPQATDSEIETEDTQSSESENVSEGDQTDDSEVVTGDDQTGTSEVATGEDQTDTSEATTGDDQTNDPEVTVEGDQPSDTEVATGDTQSNDPEQVTEDVQTNKPEEGTEAAPSNSIIFEIESGMSSNKVSLLLEDIGLIEDNRKFNEYVYERGKAELIRIGSYSLPMGASYQEILEAITK